MTKWIIVVDDDTADLQTAGSILSRGNMRVTALRSGRALIDYIGRNGRPDLILLDIKMPEMDGFETLAKLREFENANALGETPVVFLTADEDQETEARCIEAGVSEHIRKPFDPDLLIRCVENIVSKQDKMPCVDNEAPTDDLTGFLSKDAAGKEFSALCSVQTGSLWIIVLDSFRLVNDVYGSETGSRLLKSAAEIIAGALPEKSRISRLGEDEFAAFCPVLYSREEAVKITAGINEKVLASAAEILGGEMRIPLGVSAGIAFAPEHGSDYDALLKLAEKALYTVSQNGKHGCAVYEAEDFREDEEDIDIHTVSAILGERSIPNVALRLDSDAFAYVYRYVMRYIIRNNRTACKVMFTLSPNTGTSRGEFGELCGLFGDHIRDSLRKSDIFMRNRSDKYFVFLTDVREEAVGKVIESMLSAWEAEHGERILITYETEFVGAANERLRFADRVRVAVVDDDTANLQMAGHILSKCGYYVTAFRSGQALLDHLEENLPDLILLDINMPGMDGFETMKQLRDMEREISGIPVIFLTAEESAEAESKGLSLGAMDFIKKPFVPEVLMLRVRHTIELITLQRSLSSEVERKSRENRELFIHVVKSLADAIDAKDTYTNGHSGRVAEYSKEIAKRAGYSLQAQNDIYMMGLLHDVGKIGVPDAVINKPSRLTDDEFELIKNHPVMGARILKNIKEMPKLATGARWHHERYGGGGYPDGLKGEDIPEEARIIAVADAYDAMTSRRSYRDVLSQEHVRSEIEKGSGTQFDPRFAEIMLAMIDEDTGYNMREM